MSYHLGAFAFGMSIPGVPGVVTTTAPRTTTDPNAELNARIALEHAAKDAAQDTEREIRRQTDMLKRQAERQDVSDVNLPGQEFHEDWEEVPGEEVPGEEVIEPEPEQKVPWLLIGIGGAAVLGVGYWVWKR